MSRRGWLGALAAGLALAASGATFVAPDGSATAGGTSWDDAQDLPTALANAAAGDELWLKAGTYTTNGSFTAAGVRIPVGLALKGGFTGAGGTSDARADGAESIFEGSHVVTNVVTVTATSGTVALDRIVLQHGFARGLLSSGKAVNLALTDVRLHENGLKWKLGFNGSLHGRGAYLVGTSAVTLAMTNCVVSGNLSGKAYTSEYSSEHGCGMYVTTYKSFTMTDTLFATNGLSNSKNGRATSYGGGLYLEAAPITARNCRFIGNSSATHTSTYGSVIYITGTGCSGSSFQNCLFLGNFGNAFNSPTEIGEALGTIHVGVGDLTKTVTFRNCTFAYNRYLGTHGAAGIAVASGTARVYDSIFWGNFAKTTLANVSADVRVRSTSGALYVDHSLMMSDDAAYASAATGATLEMTDMVYGKDPLFVTDSETILAMANKSVTLPYLDNVEGFLWSKGDLMTVDLHVKSIGGRWDGTAWVKDAETSPAVDAGAGAVRDEPTPNGGLVNLGYYGGSEYASKTPPADVSLGDVTVTEDDWTRPSFAVTMGGSGSYRVAVYLCYGETAGSSDGTNGWAKVVTVASAAQLGETVTASTRTYFDTGDTLHYRYVVIADGETLTSKGGTFTITAAPPPFRGHGGDAAKVVHVRATACDGDGSDWEHAYGTLAEAAAALTAAKSEIWVMGDVAMDCDAAIAQAVALRGGFTGLEDAASERAAGAYSVLDAKGHNQLQVTAAQGTTVVLDAVEISRAVYHGLYVSGGANLSLTDVRLVGNGTITGVSVVGRGLYYHGNSWKGSLAMTNCLVGGNRLLDGSSAYYSPGHSHGMYVDMASSVILENVTVASNGCRRTEAPCRDGSYTAGGLRIVTLRCRASNCRFLGNGVTRRGAGGTLEFKNGSSGGYVFSNCLFAANFQNRWQSSDASTSCGNLYFELGSKTYPATFQNCTFAYNICDGTGGCAGVAVYQGTATFRECVFWGNYVQSNFSTIARDVRQLTNVAAIRLDRCIMEAEGYPWVDCRVTTADLTKTGMIYGDPLLVSTTNDFNNATTTSGQVWGSPYFKSDEALGAFNVHLRGKRGYCDETTGEVVRFRGANSPALDAGAAEPGREPWPNGKRRNLGYWGGTPWATMTPQGATRVLLR